MMENIISVLVILGGIAVAAGSVKSDTMWIRRILDKHIETDEKKFSEIYNHLMELGKK